VLPENVPPNMRLLSFNSTILDTAVSYTAYLPKGYHDDQRMRYPVIYLLPGMAGDCRAFGKQVEAYELGMREKDCPPAIIIGVQAVYGSYYTDARDGGRPIESVIVRELVERVDNVFRTIPDREHRAIEGFAMGGWGAAHLAFKYPDVFGAVSIFSAPIGTFDFFLQENASIVADVWGNDRSYFDENDPFVLASKNRDALNGRTKIRLYCGDKDRYAVLTEDMHRQLDALGIAHEFKLVRDADREFPKVWSGVGMRVMTFWKDAFPPYVPPPPETRPATTRAAPKEAMP